MSIALDDLFAVLAAVVLAAVGGERPFQPGARTLLLGGALAASAHVSVSPNTTAAGSYALLHCADARLDGVRAGSALLGRCRRTKDDGLSTVGHGEAGIAEMRWLPKGTHDWHRFITPHELAQMAEAAGLTVVDRCGMVFNPLGWSWSLSHRDLSVNYVLTALREA